MVSAAFTRHRRNKAMALPREDITAPTASVSLDPSSKKGVRTCDNSMWKHLTRQKKKKINMKFYGQNTTA